MARPPLPGRVRTPIPAKRPETGSGFAKKNAKEKEGRPRGAPIPARPVGGCLLMAQGLRYGSGLKAKFPLAVHAFEAAVVVGGHVEAALALAAVQPHIAAGSQDAPVNEIPV